MEDEQRLSEQLKWRIAGWILINIIMFSHFGLGAILSIAGVLWLILGTLFVLTVWSMIAATFERIHLMIGWNIYLWRLLEIGTLGAISRVILGFIL